MPRELFAKPLPPLFGAHIAPQCAYCTEGCWNAAHTVIFCPHLGVMRPEDSCERYAYDPLRREPKTPPRLPSYDPDDFAL